MPSEEMNLVDHLAELRKRLIVTLLTFTAALAISFIFVRDIYLWLVRNLDQKLTILGPSDILWVYFVISGVCAIAATIPMAGYQVWSFVKPALKENEQKATLSFIPALAILFIVGLAFGYFILFPMVLMFLQGMAGDFETMYTAEKYFTFMLYMTLPFGLLFEMPVIVMFLTRLGIVNPVLLSKSRKLAYFILTVVAVLVTPPDPMSDILVIVPLFGLYEVSIWLSKITYRKKLSREQAELGQQLGAE
ncbi:twin-arginine translocase subunit TatC [Paenibacillus turpanensis]|uniref:twin-arginine translocase subunit TatC n=1 Tax=Paenibacillus turpanensis TaxID=2689078 RepID=UPI00140B8652|nr:twin-arginine translocase subunit TatC [Paenibacillus turpanensis]